MKKQIIKFLKAGIDKPNFSDDVRKAITVNTFSIVGTLSLLYFLIGGIINKDYLYSIILIILASLMVINMFVFQKTKKIILASTVVTSMMFLLNIMLLIFLGVSTTGLFWCYIFPLVAFFLVGRKVGLYFTFTLLISTIIILKIKIPGITIYPAELHERFIVSYVSTSTVAFIFEYIREVTFSAFVVADSQKTEYLEETLMQKEEIQVHAELLAQKNIELSQLSIVASETDNAILIADKDGKPEWINRKFENIYGLTLEDLSAKGQTIFDTSKNKEMLEKIYETKGSIVYLNQTFDKNDNKIWVQTTATAVFENNKLAKIVILETDITQQKLNEERVIEQVEELRQQREEILAQREELISKNDTISEKNEAIRQSLEYALTIQNAILPNLNNVSKKLDNFLIFMPKDIVSGDFYWAERIGEVCYFAVTDCTGHGVPAAFLSILGARMMSEILLYKNIESPAAILDEMHKSVNFLLKQNEKMNNDGMDILLCRIEKKSDNNTEVKFCGAKRPFIYYDLNEKKIVRIQGTRKSIGGIRFGINDIKFEDNVMEFPNKTVIYLTSDGFVDQHNIFNKKLGTTSFLNILEENANYELEKQKKNIKEFITVWKGEAMQTDDITIWGIKL